MYVHGMRDLFQFKGWVVEKVSIHPEVVHVKLRCDLRCKPHCSKGGPVMSTNHVETRQAGSPRALWLAYDSNIGTLCSKPRKNA